MRVIVRLNVTGPHPCTFWCGDEKTGKTFRLNDQGVRMPLSAWERDGGVKLDRVVHEDDLASIDAAVALLLATDHGTPLQVSSMSAGYVLAELCEKIPEFAGEQSHIVINGQPWPPTLMKVEESAPLAW